MRNFALLHNAIMFEILQCIDVNTQKVDTSKKTHLFDEVLGFYDHLNEFFKYEINIRYEEYSLMIKDDANSIRDWCVENDVIYLFKDNQDYSLAGNGSVVFTFVNEADASAFKLKWL